MWSKKGRRVFDEEKPLDEKDSNEKKIDTTPTDEQANEPQNSSNTKSEGEKSKGSHGWCCTKKKRQEIYKNSFKPMSSVVFLMRYHYETEELSELWHVIQKATSSYLFLVNQEKKSYRQEKRLAQKKRERERKKDKESDRMV